MSALSGWFARAGASLAVAGVAAAVAVLAVAFLSAALCLWLTDLVGLPLAALITGAVLLAVAGLLLLALGPLARRPRPPAAAVRPEGEATAAALGEMLGEEAATWTKRHPAAAMLAALAAGFVVGTSPSLRAKLLRLLQ